MPRREVRKHRITVVMSEGLKNRLEVYADECDRSMSDFIRLVCKDWIQGKEALDAEEEGA